MNGEKDRQTADYNFDKLTKNCRDNSDNQRGRSRVHGDGVSIREKVEECQRNCRCNDLKNWDQAEGFLDGKHLWTQLVQGSKEASGDRQTPRLIRRYDGISSKFAKYGTETPMAARIKSVVLHHLLL